MTRNTQIFSSPGDESDIQILWSGRRPTDVPCIQEAIRDYPGYCWPGVDEPMPGELEPMTPAESAAYRSSAWRRANPAKASQHRARYYARYRTGGPAPTQAERLELLASVAYRCQCCSRHQSELDEPLVLDHILPVSRGGRNGVENRQVLCAPCNRKKGARTIRHGYGVREGTFEDTQR